MVNITHRGENVLKTNLILEAAQKRFGMYGLEKTTMHEIAQDAGLSKASLYYYFPDKLQLFHAVIEKEQQEFLTFLSRTFDHITEPEDKLREYLVIRNNYFKTFLNLSKIRISGFKEFKPVLPDLYRQLRETESSLISSILEEGQEKNLFMIKELAETADLFLDILQSIRWTILKNKDMAYMDGEDFALLEKRSEIFIDIFLKGISK
ncbi:MAG TPA: TetR/AcrR family transcriptional regulator [Bacteroidales bacterium]|nr:TetR/AcrR family transcriptional regulator [Bacteroidales bacterium]